MSFPLEYDDDFPGALHAIAKRIGRNAIRGSCLRLGRSVTFLSLKWILLFDFENSHHAVIFVIEDVTVEHPLPGIIVVANDDSR
jgi:hypothetical protein